MRPSGRFGWLLAGLATVVTAGLMTWLVPWLVTSGDEGSADRPSGSSASSGEFRASDSGRGLEVSEADSPATSGEPGGASPVSPKSPGAPQAHRGSAAPSGRATFAPTRLSYRAGDQAPIWSEVDAVRTLADGRLNLPPADRIGWWSGSAEAGQKLGSIVLAGHVDSTEGFGFMASLLGADPGELITLTGAGERQQFRITDTRTVERSALSADADWNDQGGPLQLVLITCYGHYDPVARDYAQNLIITARPVE